VIKNDYGASPSSLCFDGRASSPPAELTIKTRCVLIGFENYGFMGPGTNSLATMIAGEMLKAGQRFGRLEVHLGF